MIDPGWLSAGAAAILGFVGAWAALRVTVSSLKEDVASLKSLLLQTTTHAAQIKAIEEREARAREDLERIRAELERVRTAGHDTRNRMTDLSERIARMEAREEEP